MGPCRRFQLTDRLAPGAQPHRAQPSPAVLAWLACGKPCQPSPLGLRRPGGPRELDGTQTDLPMEPKRFQLTERAICPWRSAALRAILPRCAGLAGMLKILPAIAAGIAAARGAKGAHGTPTGLSLYPTRACLPFSTNHLV